MNRNYHRCAVVVAAAVPFSFLHTLPSFQRRFPFFSRIRFYLHTKRTKIDWKLPPPPHINRARCSLIIITACNAERAFHQRIFSYYSPLLPCTVHIVNVYASMPKMQHACKFFIFDVCRLLETVYLRYVLVCVCV